MFHENKIKVFSSILLVGSLTGCFDTNNTTTPTPKVAKTTVTGMPVKGPLAHATVTVYHLDKTKDDLKGEQITQGSTDSQAQIQSVEIPNNISPPFLFEFTSTSQTVDLMTEKAPVIPTLRTVILNKDQLSAPLYATTLTTLAVDIVAEEGPQSADIEEHLSEAANKVVSTVGFGLDDEVDIFTTPPILDSSTDTKEEQKNTAAYRAATETLAAIVTQAAEETSTGSASKDALTVLAKDLATSSQTTNAGSITGEIAGATEQENTLASKVAELLQTVNPAELTIPNTNIKITELEEELKEERADTGNSNVESVLTNSDIAVKPAILNPDKDGDGVLNSEDAFPEDKNEQVDTDEDGIGNNADTDDDNDGVLDSNDAFKLDASEQLDTDNDGVGNNADTDDDGDGVNDNEDDFPLDSTRHSKTDQDNDGWPAEQDSNDNDANIPGTPFIDTDGDGLGNALDPDDDGDGVNDESDLFPLDKNEQVDTDGDGIGNNADPDDDNDNANDSTDAFPLDSSESKDTDGDGIGDNSDPDIDGDGLNNEQDPNSFSVDSDSDGILDNQDAFPDDASESLDTDKDGTGDNTDAFPNDPAETMDTDNDGTGDNQDAFPNDPSETVDTDKDGTGDNQDAFPNDPSETVDTDKDGVGDNKDAFPNDPSETVDTDKDGVGDNKDTFPNDPTEVTDSDKDGTGDNKDAFPNDPTEVADSDKDGIGDNADTPSNTPDEVTDSDQDTISDTEDNCPAIANTNQSNQDGDAYGDACDTTPNFSGEPVTDVTTLDNEVFSGYWLDYDYIDLLGRFSLGQNQAGTESIWNGESWVTTPNIELYLTQSGSWTPTNEVTFDAISSDKSAWEMSQKNASGTPILSYSLKFTQQDISSQPIHAFSPTGKLQSGALFPSGSIAYQADITRQQASYRLSNCPSTVQQPSDCRSLNERGITNLTEVLGNHTFYIGNGGQEFNYEAKLLGSLSDQSGAIEVYSRAHDNNELTLVETKNLGWKLENIHNTELLVINVDSQYDDENRDRFFVEINNQVYRGKSTKEDNSFKDLLLNQTAATALENAVINELPPIFTQSMLAGNTFYSASQCQGVRKDISVQFNDDGSSLITENGENFTPNYQVNKGKLQFSDESGDFDGGDYKVLRALTNSYFEMDEYRNHQNEGSVRLYMEQDDANSLSIDELKEDCGDNSDSTSSIPGVISGQITIPSSESSPLVNPWIRFVPMQLANNDDYRGITCQIEANGSYGSNCFTPDNSTSFLGLFIDPSTKFQVAAFSNTNDDTHWNPNETSYCYTEELSIANINSSLSCDNHVISVDSGDTGSGSDEDNSSGSDGNTPPDSDGNTPPDADGDGFSDQDETKLGSDPNDSTSTPANTATPLLFTTNMLEGQTIYIGVQCTAQSPRQTFSASFQANGVMQNTDIDGSTGLGSYEITDNKLYTWDQDEQKNLSEYKVLLEQTSQYFKIREIEPGHASDTYLYLSPEALSNAPLEHMEDWECSED